MLSDKPPEPAHVLLAKETMIEVGGRGRPEMIGMLAAAGLSVVMMASNLGAFLSPFDGGISSSAATFTLHGLLPYRDYWLLYGPLSGLLLAIPTAILGPSIELLRALGIVVFGCLAIIAYRVARVWAARGPAIALSVSAVVMVPAILSLDVSAWPIAMTLALSAIYVSIGTNRSGLLIGLLVGLSLLSRLDVGVYALVAVLLVRARRDVMMGFALIAVPFIAFLLATTAPSALFEQLIWYPIVGPRQFRGLAGPVVDLGQPIVAMFALPLVILPRLAILLAAIRLIQVGVTRRWDQTATKLLSLAVFATACQLQTIGRADLEHFAQAATPSIVLLAVWFPTARPALSRFAVLVAMTAACVVVGLTGHMFHGGSAAYDRNLLATSSWLQDATRPDDRIFVGLTSHQFAVSNPLIVYYLADRAAAVHDTMFNPGITNTDWGQARMVSDLERTSPTYLVLDRVMANLRELAEGSRIAGSTSLDAFISANYHPVCDMDDLVIEARNGTSEVPMCPATVP